MYIIPTRFLKNPAIERDFCELRLWTRIVSICTVVFYENVSNFLKTFINDEKIKKHLKKKNECAIFLVDADV